VVPPVQTQLARLVDRADHQAQLDRQQLDLDQLDRYVAGDDHTFVEDALEQIGEVGALRVLGGHQRLP
jgi:hypothetical protein